MNDDDLLRACKQGLNIPESSTAFDAVLNQKIQAVKSFMVGGGVSEPMLADPAAVGAIVVGVTDIWNLSGGRIRFSHVFYTLTNQLAARSLVKKGEGENSET